ncbi:hypothetical protein CALCODRAFT_231997 [Calocera cornea HHB12733]|uniref:Uncharacterized protein n=1 Tax=Calocera cornea HHB12733 TaxID=1353952 RepID=A0A165H0A7_9BASI|nr:hypothetical protein CALCODRAFT_231997 [Calocera cornea HHB12733]
MHPSYGPPHRPPRRSRLTPCDSRLPFPVHRIPDPQPNPHNLHEAPGVLPPSRRAYHPPIRQSANRRLAPPAPSRPPAARP